MRKSLACFVAMAAMLMLPVMSWGTDRFNEAAEAPFEKPLLKTAAKWTRY